MTDKIPQKTKANPPDYHYGNTSSTNLDSTPVDVAESGTVRMAVLLDALDEALKDIPGAAHQVSAALLKKLGANPGTRITP